MHERDGGGSGRREPVNGGWTARVRNALKDATPMPDEDVLEELAQHARSAYEAACADGCSRDEAEARVAELLGRWRAEAAALRRRSHRPPAVSPPPSARPSRRVIGVWQDVRYAARLLLRQPRHASLTIATMALGIGATTALFSVVYGVLIRPLPWPQADRIVVLRETRGGSSPRFGEFSNAAYLAWRENAATIEDVAAWSSRLMILAGAGEPDRIRVTAATASVFRVLGVRPLVGTLFDDRDETARVVVLSEDLWRQRFGAAADVIGRVVRLDDQPYAIVGVLSAAHAYPDRHARAIIPYDVPLPAGNHLAMFSAIARLRPGPTAAQAAAEGTSRGRHAAETGLTTRAIFGSDGPVRVSAQPLHDALTTEARDPLLVLLAAVGLLLVTATANVAGLQLARATARRREMALRAALGAGAGRLTRQLLAENLLVGLAGGAGGLALAWLLLRVIPTLLPADFPRVEELGIDATIVWFALAVSVGTSLAFGLLPAWHVRRVDLVASLAEDGTAPVGAGLRSPATRMRTIIMAGQVAVACVLLAGASLLGRSFAALISADRGYETAGVLSARLSMPQAMYPTAERRFAVVDEVLGRLAATPGVSAAAFTSELPLTPGGSTAAFTLQPPHGAPVTVQASPRIVSPQYFAALGMRVVAGRTFSDADAGTSEPVVVVNRSFARQYLGDAPLGARLPMAGYGPPDGEPRDTVVVGVVDDVRYVTAADATQPELFYSHRQMQGGLPVQTITLLARTSGDFSAAAAALRSSVRSSDERLIADAVMPLEQRLSATLAQPRLSAALLGGFAGLALIIAAVGLFGLLSYAVSQRSRELAIRAALGARQSDLLQLVVRQALTVIGAGTFAGLLASIWLARLLAAQLYGVTPHDPVTFALIPVVLLAAGVLACLGPALRAARLDPVRALRRG